MMTNKTAFAIALLLFIIPFFWLPWSNVDMGGDSGRIYFIAPLETLEYRFGLQNEYGSNMYAFFVNNSAYSADINVTGINGSISMDDNSGAGSAGPV